MNASQHSYPETELEELQRITFDYFLRETNPESGLVPDSTRQGAPCSIAPTGFALASYPIGVERGFITREDAIRRTLTTLRFFWNSPQGPEPDGTGYNGFYYHFLDMSTGRRVWDCELSTIDSTFLIAGALTGAEYFNRDTEDEREIRMLGDAIYRRADWQWAQNLGATVTHGWRPESGFIRYRWQGYNEALILYVLGLASPTHPLPEQSYKAWTRTYEWRSLYGHEFLYAGPATRKIGGKLRRFYDYEARGVPDGPDDGTLAPWAVISSLPFAPEIVLPSIQSFDEAFPEMTSEYGFKCSFNPTFSAASGGDWISKGYYGLDQGPIVLMIENYRSGFLWRLMRHCPHIINGLRRAGFSGGWLG